MGCGRLPRGCGSARTRCGRLGAVAEGGIADDVLRDLYVRGKYRDVLLPMVVLRRLDAVLEPTKELVLGMKKSLDKAGVDNQDAPLRQAAGQAFYNTSQFTIRDLRGRTSQQKVKADFEAYLDGFSSNVQEILNSFEFRNQVPRLPRADALGTLIEKFLDPKMNLSPARAPNGSGEAADLDSHAMGTIFEEFVRKFNEENNEEAGEHWTARDAVKLMAELIFLPVAEALKPGTYLLYDGACGTGWLLGDPAHYDRDYAVDLVQLRGFLKAIQEDLLESLQLESDGPARKQFLARLQGEVTKFSPRIDNKGEKYA